MRGANFMKPRRLAAAALGLVLLRRRGETVPGATGVAVPIRRADPLTPGAIDLAGPSDRMTPDLIELALPEMRAAAQQILEVSVPFGSRA